MSLAALGQVCLIMLVVLATYRSVMVPLRLAFALLFTLGATYGAGIAIERNL